MGGLVRDPLIERISLSRHLPGGKHYKEFQVEDRVCVTA